jgi:hypothetical protein
MRRNAFFHLLFLVLFFSIGAAALGVAVLSDDFVQYCRNRQLVRDAELSLERLQSLNAEYDALLQQLDQDPDLVKRIAPVTLGTPRTDPNTAYPKARAQELAVARKALVEQSEQDPPAPDLPMWLQRCSQPAKRMILFISGASLILISLVCFTTERHQAPSVKS